MDDGDGFLGCLIPEDGKHRSENFLLHDAAVRGDVRQYDGMEEEVVRIMVSFPCDGSSAGDRVICEFIQPIEMSAVDDPGITRRGSNTFLMAKHAVCFHDDRFNQFIGDALVYKNIVRGDTRLSAVDKLGYCYAASRFLNIGRLIYDGRRLSSKFQRHRRKVLGGRRHYELSNGRTTGEKDMVERQLEEFLRNFDATFAYSHNRRIKDFLTHLREEVRCMRRHFRRFNNDSVAGGERRNEG